MRVAFLSVVVVWSYAVAVEDASVLSRLRPLASLPFFEGARHAQMLDWSSRWREELFGRVRFVWSGSVAGPIKVFAKAPPWLTPDYRVNSTCDVPCDYAESLETAHAALSNLKPVAPYGGRVANALMSFEPSSTSSRVRWSSGSDPRSDRRPRVRPRRYQFCKAGECVSLSFPRTADAVYEFFPPSSIDWAARPTPPRPSTPSSIVFVSHCGYQWRMNYLLDLAAAGVDIKFAGACNRTFYDRRCKRKDAFSKCKIAYMSKFPFALAFENSVLDDYVTEKWGHAWQSGAVVVYAGSPLIDERRAEWPPFINARKRGRRERARARTRGLRSIEAEREREREREMSPRGPDVGDVPTTSPCDGLGPRLSLAGGPRRVHGAGPQERHPLGVLHEPRPAGTSIATGGDALRLAVSRRLRVRHLQGPPTRSARRSSRLRHQSFVTSAEADVTTGDPTAPQTPDVPSNSPDARRDLSWPLAKVAGSTTSWSRARTASRGGWVPALSTGTLERAQLR